MKPDERAGRQHLWFGDKHIALCQRCCMEWSQWEEIESGNEVTRNKYRLGGSVGYQECIGLGGRSV